MEREPKNSTLSWEDFCKYCKEPTKFTALSIPTDLPGAFIHDLVFKSRVDCCYECYDKHEVDKRVAKTRKIIT